MGCRHPNPKRVKIHRSYSVEEAAGLLNAHKNSIRAWLKNGLAAIDDRRPALIHGQVLADFLRARRQKARRRCAPGEIYCVRCRAPKRPAADMADYIPITAGSGNLRGICPSCEALIHRRVTLAKIDDAKGNLAVAVPQARPHIAERGDPSVNCDFDIKGGTHD